MKYLLNAAVLAGLAVYTAVFYAVPLPSVLGPGGQPLRRIDLLWQILLLPDDWLFSAWFGTPPQFSLFDRLPVLLAAGAILLWAGVLGWLILRCCGANRLVRSREKKPFSPGVHAGKVGLDSRSVTHPAWTPGLNESATSIFQLSRLETFVFSLGAGLAVLSTWTLLMGLCGVLDRTWVFTLPAVATLAAAIWSWRRQRKSRRPTAAGASADRSSAGASAGVAVKLPPQQSELPPQHILGGATDGRGFVSDVLRSKWLWLALPFVLAIVLSAMLPPMDFDVREYHLEAPKEFFQQGRITFLPHNVYANMPLGAGDVRPAGNGRLRRLVAGGPGRQDGDCRLYAPLRFGPVRRRAEVLFHRGGRGRRAGLYLDPLGGGRLDGRPDRRRPGLLPVSGGICFAAEDYPRGGLAGLFAGAAVATKYPAALFVLAPLAVWAVFASFSKRGSSIAQQTRKASKNSRGLTAPAAESRNSSSFGGRFSHGFFVGGLLTAAKRLTLYLLLAAAVCGPWFAKNWAFTGNPVYPLLYEQFDGRTWNAEKNARWDKVHLPHDFTWETLGKDLGDVFLTSEWLSPLVVPLAALALLGTLIRIRPLASSQWLVWSLFAYFAFVIAAWWLCTHRIDRFWIPALPVLALLAGAGACWNVHRWWRGLLRLLLIAVLAANFLVASAGSNNAWFVPLDDLRNDPQRIGPWHWFFNTQLPGGGLLAVGDAAVFDIQRPVWYSTCFDDCVFEQLVKGKTAAEIRAELQQRKIAYVYVDWDEIARYRSPGNYGFTPFVQPAVFQRLAAQGVLQPMPIAFQGHAGRLYRVK